MIVRNKDIGFGQPIIKGRRITVYNIISFLYDGGNLDSYISDFDFTLNDIREAVHYCKNTLCGELKNEHEKYCDGCILSTISQGRSFSKNDYIEFINDDGKFSISKDKNQIYLGSLEDLDNTEFGRIGWEMAEEVNQKWSLI